MRRNIAACLLFLGAFALYSHTAAPAITTGDSGEFMTAAGTLSIPHAPSFPLFTVSARAFIDLLHFGGLPYRINIFSAFLSSLSLTLIFLIGYELTRNIFLSLLVPFLIGFSASFWTNSLVTEVFALNTFFLCLLMFCLVKGIQSPKFLSLFVFLFSLGLGNHHILVAVAPAFLFLAIRTQGIKEFLNKIPFYSVLFILGLSVYLFLPLRAVKEPPINWGNPTNVERLTRTLTRKDYGSFSLALGDAPQRNVSNTAKQLKTFGWHLHQEIPWPLLLLGGLGILLGLRMEKNFYGAVGIVFLVSGPVFYLFANLPFTAQSEGIMGRFFIMPVLCLLLGWIEMGRELKKTAPVVLLALTVVVFMRGYPEASQYRSTRLAWDYGNAMLRTLPPSGILFMDGGDDAFYSLACLHFALGKRPDVELHDRGGLVYKNIYGDDFRRIPKDKKAARRIEVEKKFLGVRPLYYSTMDADVLPGESIVQDGFLMRVGITPSIAIDWPHIILRSLYPLDVSDYRSRALAAFFPYMRGRQLFKSGNLDSGLAYLREAAFIGRRVDWLEVNMTYDYSHLGYEFIRSQKYKEAEKVYLDWLAFDLGNFQAQSNFGVVLERQGRIQEALTQYEKASKLFPTEADPSYNMAVLLWPTKDWPRIHSYLSQAIQRNPRHPSAPRAMAQVERFMSLEKK